MTEQDKPIDVETTGLDGTTPIEVEPDRDGPERLPFATFASPATVGWQPATDVAALRAAARDRETRTSLGIWKAAQQRDGGTLHVITAAARTPGVGLVAAYEGTDGPGRPLGNHECDGLADGMAIRVVSRLDRHEVHHPSGDDEVAALMLRYLPAAAVTNPRTQLGVVLPDDWNTMTGGSAGYTANGLEHEVNTLEAIGLKIRHRLYVAATPATMAVHFGSLCERIDLYAAARDVLRAGGMVQVEAGATTALDAVAAVGIPPWAGWVARFDMTIVVSCIAQGSMVFVDGSTRDVGPHDMAGVATLARDAVHRAGGPAIANNGWTGTMALALVDVHKLVPGIAGWTTTTPNSLTGESGPSIELDQLIQAVEQACDGEVDVELVGTGPDTVIDLR